MRKVRKWEWMAFKNPARTDDAEFHHWRRVTDEPKEYPFAKFNKVNEMQIFISRLAYRWYCHVLK